MSPNWGLRVFVSADYNGTMNATANTTATAFRRPLGIPSKPMLDLVPADSTTTEIFHNDHLAVKIIGFRGGFENFARHFTAGSVAGYAASYNEDVEAKVAQAQERGHELHYIIAEASMIALHPLEQPVRKTIELGSLVKFDGELFQVLQAPNDNLHLVPVTNA